MEERAGHRLRQHQQSQENANRHQTPHMTINRAESAAVANRVASYYRYSYDHHLNRLWRTEASAGIAGLKTGTSRTSRRMTRYWPIAPALSMRWAQETWRLSASNPTMQSAAQSIRSQEIEAAV